MSAYQSLLSPFKLRYVTLKNRVVSSSHAPNYTDEGLPKERYQAYHEEKAKGGVGLSIFGGSSNVSRDSGSIYGQIYVGDDRVIPWFQKFADLMHQHNTALMCQITHMGRRTSWDTGEWFATMGPSVIRDPAHHSVPRVMNADDIGQVAQAFARAALRCKKGGLDGCEILATTHLLGQFLSPLSNQRIDGWGGSLDNRMRFLLQVLDRVRDRVGDQFIVGVRFAADESNEGGISAEEGVEIARKLGAHGGADFLNVNGAYGGSTKGMAETFPGMAFNSAPYIELAKKVREASGLPTLQSARLSDPATANHAIRDGFLDLAGLTRPLIADPEFVAKLERGEEGRIRPCVGAGYCIDRVYVGQDSLCIHNVSTGREQTLPHKITTAARRKKVVVVGGGVAGLEAARVSALRGHEVVLMEAAQQLGGQVLLAARASWRGAMIGITDWLISEVEQLGVTICNGVFAGQAEVVDLWPDAVIVATGGIPVCNLPEGGDDHVHSTWDVLSGGVPLPEDARILLYDEAGGHAAISTADFLTSRNLNVEMVTPDRQVGREVGGLNYPVYLRNLYQEGVILTPDLRLLSARRTENNKLVVTFRNEYSRQRLEREFDLVVADQVTVPADDVFHELMPRSRNLGQIDSDALVEGLEQPDGNPGGQYQLFRVGDAVSCRNIHAAILDSNRLCRTI